MKEISVLWLCTCQERPVGVVKAYDEIEGRWKFYVGMGRGLDEAADVRAILAWGQKYDSLRILQAFAGEAEAHGLGTAAGTDEPV